MASACINNIGVSPESFIDCPPSAFPAYGWLSPRISFSREYTDGAKPEKKTAGAPEMSDSAKDHGDFEFRVDDPVKMLPADELFSDGKLVPLQLTVSVPSPAATEEAVVLPEERKSNIADDPIVFSPKAPRCSSRWRELLGLRKSKSTSASNETTSLPSSSSTSTSKSIRQFLHRTSKSMSASDASLRLPLLKESDSESISISSSRFSLSSSSSGHDHDDFPRLSLDAADLNPSRSNRPNQSPKHPRVRMVKPRMVPVSVTENPKPLIDHPSAPLTTNRSVPRSQHDPSPIPRRVSMDSPRMISSGKIVFESLERSCSSPSSFNGGPRHRNRGVERSYSANVRIAPVLNVPVCSLRGSSSKSGVLGLGQLFSSQSRKKEANPGPGSSSNGGSKLHYYHHCSSRLWKASS